MNACCYSFRHFLTVLFVFTLTGTSLLAQQRYCMYPGNFDAVMDQICDDYPVIEIGITRPVLESHLQDLLTDYHSEIRVPHPFITGSGPFFKHFRWGALPEVDEYLASSIDLRDTDPQPVYYDLIINGVMMLFPSATRQYLVTFSSGTEDGQSGLEIIIIERDLLFTTGEDCSALKDDGGPQDDEDTQLRHASANDPSPGILGNPFTEKTNLSFFLPEDGTVSLELYDLLSGRLVDVPLPKTFFTKGSYQITVDGSHLPSGNYAAMLNAGKQRYPLRLVKIDQ